jgi:hypothetical protein
MSRRRKTSFALRCWQGIATPAALAAVAIGLHWLATIVVRGW